MHDFFATSLAYFELPTPREFPMKTSNQPTNHHPELLTNLEAMGVQSLAALLLEGGGETSNGASGEE